MIKLIETDNSYLTSQDYTNISLFENCIQDIKHKLLDYPKIFIYGKQCIQHRCIGFFSNPDVSKGYSYSGKLLKSQPLTNNLQNLLEDINNILNTDFNGILVNKYNDGNDYISSHSDDESGLSNKGVVSISHGAVRKFRIRNKKTNSIVKDVDLKPFKIIHMGGDFQKEFKHEIPIEKKIKEVRYSFTFRKHNS